MLLLVRRHAAPCERREYRGIHTSIPKKNMNPQIENSFTYHAPKEGQPEKYVSIREKAKELAYMIDELCPKSREQSVALTHLETSVFWANAAIARNP